VIAIVLIFMLNRFGGIEINTGEAWVRFFQGNKLGEETTYQSRLMVSAGHSFLTPSGVEFRVQQLPIKVVHDVNRGINSGDYRLKIIDADDTVVRRLPHVANFAESEEEMTFYGERTK
jgi:hypothetical protein